MDEPAKNTKTLQAYNAHVKDYIKGTPQEVDGDFKQWIDEALSKVPMGSTVLELGSGFGRDADYIESKGYKVIRTDAAQGFVDLLKKRGFEAIILNALTDSFGKNRDMIFANAVFLHFEPDEVKKVIQKTKTSLKKGGVLAFSLKQGTGSEWSDKKLNSPRYFKYWQESELRSLLNTMQFSKTIFTKRTTPRDKWIQIIAIK